jgi:hypothetical protein
MKVSKSWRFNVLRDKSKTNSGYLVAIEAKLGTTQVGLLHTNQEVI